MDVATTDGLRSPRSSQFAARKPMTEAHRALTDPPVADFKFEFSPENHGDGMLLGVLSSDIKLLLLLKLMDSFVMTCSLKLLVIIIGSHKYC